MSDRFSDMPDPPYYAVIFANQLSENDAGYHAMAEKMEELAKTMPGYIGRETTRDAAGFAMTVSYWTDEDAIRNWKAQADHLAGQKIGMDRWYSHYRLRVARIERHYSGPDGRDDPALAFLSR